MNDADIRIRFGWVKPYEESGDAGNYEDKPGFCSDSALEEIKGNKYVLLPGCYVGMPDLDEDDETFEEKWNASPASCIPCLRRGEIVASKWSDLDCVSRELTIQRQIKRVPRKGLQIHQSKSAAERRRIVLGSRDI